MKIIIMLISLNLFLSISCKDSQKEKELELKEREIIIKEKELKLKENEVLNNSDTSKNKQSSDDANELKYSNYCNDRFKFCIDYPSNFLPQGESHNGDGQIFLSKDNKAEIRTYGSLAVEGVNKTIDEEYNSAISDDNITYQTLKKDWFVISGLDRNGKIFYRKTVKKKINYFGHDKTDVYQTLMITYPESQKNMYSDYCKKISKSL